MTTPSTLKGSQSSAAYGAIVFGGLSNAQVTASAGKLTDAQARSLLADNPGLPKPSVSDPDLQNIVNNLYHGVTADNPIGNSGAADALRYEILTGKTVGNGTGHAKSSTDLLRALKKWVSKKTGASESDIAEAKSLITDVGEAVASVPADEHI